MIPIARLPQSSRTILRSTTILTSIPQIIHELVQNSLDANASRIEISVNMNLWQCCVRDNGHGIDKTDMSVLAKGGEEGRYGSSKLQDKASLDFVSTLGFRGEALASAADVSILEITSRTALALDTWSAILKGGKSLYYGPAIRWKRESAGTTVIVRDAFYNLPVRRRSHQNTTQTFESIRKDLECIAMVFPHVAFSLENSAKEQNEGFGKGRILTIPKTNSSLATFRHLFGRNVCETFEDVDAREGDVYIRGFLGVEGIYTKLHQYIYLNRQLLSPCEFHRIIDARLTSSSFGRNASETDVGVPTKRAIRRSPRKSERRFVYLLSITLPSHLVDNCLEPAKALVKVKDSDILRDFLDRVIRSFLVRNGFTSSSHKRGLDDSTDSPSKRHRIAKTAEFFAENHSYYPLDSQASNPAPFINPLCHRAEKAQWADPLTRPIFGRGQRHKVEDHEHGDVDFGQRHTDSRHRKIRTGMSMTPVWIQDTLEVWKNPTFGYGENDIRSVAVAVSQGGQSCSNPRACLPNQFFLIDEDFAVTTSANFTRTQLENAEVVGQVDEKFVACILEDVSTRPVKQTLILVDQHAADERVRVERFLSEICDSFIKQDKSMTAQLEPPVPLLLNKFEAEVLRQNAHLQNVFRRWGFKLELAVEAEISQVEELNIEDGCLQILISEVPELLSEKLLIGDELREFIKSCLARMAVEGSNSNIPQMSGRSHWTSALRLCPRELVDLINSKACRGAIMFNDDLDLDQCRRLMFQLSKTVWPFRCAHGRPSLIPLTGVELEEAVKKKPINWSKFKVS